MAPRGLHGDLNVPGTHLAFPCEGDPGSQARSVPGLRLAELNPHKSHSCYIPPPMGNSLSEATMLWAEICFPTKNPELRVPSPLGDSPEECRSSPPGGTGQVGHLDQDQASPQLEGLFPPNSAVARGRSLGKQGCPTPPQPHPHHKEDTGRDLRVWDASRMGTAHVEAGPFSHSDLV